MTESTERPRRRLYVLHRWIGLLFALLGMLVFFSGAVATFHHELDMWASRGERFVAPEDAPSFDFDEAYRVASAGVDPKYLHQVDVFAGDGRPLQFFFHEHIPDGMDVQEIGVTRDLDPATLAIVDERVGDGTVAFRPRPANALSRFFIDLHIFLLLPETLGLIATGFAGFALLLLIGTGTLVHRPTAEKLGRRPRTHRKRLFVGDLHTLVGSWSLPFTVIVALTGTFFSFAGVVLVPVVAMVAFDGDQEALVRAVVGKVQVAESDEVASLDPIVNDALDRSDGARFVRVGLDHWGERDATATVALVEPSPFGDTPINYVYDGHTGAFVQEKPLLGTQPSLSNTLLGLVADLHFGTLLGLLTKLLWGLLGFATCALAATGLLIYVARRRDADDAASRFVRAMTVALSGGLPLATGAAFLGWIGAYAAGADDPRTAMTWVFLSTLGLCACLGAVTRVRPALAVTWGAAGVSLLFAVVLAPLATRTSFASTWASAALRHTLIVDASLVFIGVSFVVGAVLARRSWRMRAFDAGLAGPGEANETPNTEWSDDIEVPQLGGTQEGST
ncbi:MAG: PepSY-associated TM helix domain-containing protein [Myxococcota bacterium]